MLPISLDKARQRICRLFCKFSKDLINLTTPRLLNNPACDPLELLDRYINHWRNALQEGHFSLARDVFINRKEDISFEENEKLSSMISRRDQLIKRYHAVQQTRKREPIQWTLFKSPNGNRLSPPQQVFHPLPGTMVNPRYSAHSRPYTERVSEEVQVCDHVSH